MNSPELNPAVQKAFDYIKGNLENGIWQQGEKLPPTRRLAARAGVSFATIIQAITALKTKGLISGVPRGSIRAGDGSFVHMPAANLDSALWRMKRMAFEKDILTGMYAQGDQLPSLKELQIRYGVCFQTMRKILRSMVEDRVLRLQANRYEHQTFQGRHSRQRIVFITYRVPPGPWSALNQGRYRVLDLLEHECIRRDHKLEIVEIDFYNSIETRRAISGSGINAPAFGYVLDLWWNPGEMFRRSHIDLLTHLSELKKPVAILDETGDFTLALPFTTNPMLQVFRIQGKDAGARMARLLLGMGHRSVAYISMQHAFPWSKQRLEGVMEQYSKAGYYSGVHPVFTEKLGASLLNVLAISGYDDRLIQKLISIGRTESQAEDQFKEYVTFKEAGSLQRFDPKKIKDLQKKLTAVANLLQQDLDKKYLERIIIPAMAEIGERINAMALETLFIRAAKVKDITAWICATDGTAMAALEFLRNHRIPVPGRISVAGFDNSPIDALENRLTSFDFNASGFIHRMLNFIARPPKPRGPYYHVPIEVEGIVMQRDTTARPPIQ